MANAFTAQTIQEGPRNATIKLVGVLDTSNLASTLAVDVSALSGDGQYAAPTKVRIDKIEYAVSDQLAVQLLWDATTDVVIEALTGRGEVEACRFGGLQNNAGAGVTGDINILTTGWASGTQTFSITLQLVKQY